MCHCFFPYPGSQARLLEKLPILPLKSADTFVSLFGGSGADLMLSGGFRKKVFNDADPSVATVMRVIQDDEKYDELTHKIKKMVFNIKEFDNCLIALKERKNEVEIAYAFLVIAYQGRGEKRHPIRMALSDWRGVRCYGDNKWQVWFNLPQKLDYLRYRLRGVSIHCRDWEYIWKKYNKPNSFMIIDPPFHPATTRASTRMYANSFIEHSHARLLEALSRSVAKVLLIGYDHESYRQVLRKKWRADNYLKPGATRPTTVWRNF